MPDGLFVLIGSQLERRGVLGEIFCLLHTPNRPQKPVDLSAVRRLVSSFASDCNSSIVYYGRPGSTGEPQTCQVYPVSTYCTWFHHWTCHVHCSHSAISGHRLFSESITQLLKIICRSADGCCHICESERFCWHLFGLQARQKEALNERSGMPRARCPAASSLSS